MPFHYRISASRILWKFLSLLIFCTCLHICTTSDVESDIDFLTIAGQDMQDLQRPPPAPCGVSPLRRGLVPLCSIVFRQFSQLFRCEGVDKLTHACVASDQAGPEGNTKKKYTAKSAGRKVRRAGELCQSTVSTFVTASDAKSSGCTASHRCTRGRES